MRTSNASNMERTEHLECPLASLSVLIQGITHPLTAALALPERGKVKIILLRKHKKFNVAGFEPAPLWKPSKRSGQLSYMFW